MGRRGGILLLVGSLWVLVGASVLTPSRPFNDVGPPFPVLLADSNPYVLTITGLLAIVFAMRPKDGIGFISLMITPFFSIVIGLYKMVEWFVTQNDTYTSSHAVSLLLWTICFLLLQITSGWAETPYTFKQVNELEDQNLLRESD